MNKFASIIKSNLLGCINQINELKSLYVRNPEKDFTRKRRLSFTETIRLILSMGGKSLNLELLDYFFYDEPITKSAFVQRRDKIIPDAFKDLFYYFNDTLKITKFLDGYRLLAVDGSDFIIAHNPDEKDYYQPAKEGTKGVNLLHLNAMYDLLNRFYIDALIQPKLKTSERQALIQMVERSKINHKAIIIADRGYENYNVLEYIRQKGWHYLVRIKDVDSNGIASGLSLPNTDVFDVDYSFLMTRRYTNEIKNNPKKYKYLPQNQNFDFLPVGSKETYPFKFRILRFPITETTYEVIITSLDRETFPAKRIKELYHMRWGIETSFRQLKYTIGLINFHSKKVEYVHQEIYAKLTMYNFCEAITNQIILKQTNTKYAYQLNYTVAIAVCKHFFRLKANIPPPNVEALIRKNILPVRPGRKDPRKVRSRTAVSFMYRVA